ncbi:hypothetical protein AMATHDRAFT_81409 [Amanita thiersii Skay4041]|uniref:SGT1-domain-containing protein n=1 Tax=Amanita thiersii Skay4041 TaxID=703135 RepID=A0A2A9NNE7_9AGAR|nr:hypothetical protein AMATHDRAFT_81409 [Amanita thiersii Skay4041]
MDIFNRPPAIAEDTLHYSLYPSSASSDSTSVSSFAACISAFAEDLLPNFIWHRDSFELKVVKNPDSDGYILEGIMRVGDSVDDEWCTVWLLKQISAQWDLVISVFDSDGEFLLIEAARALPPWVKPSNAENRVWIYKSRLHLVPLSHVSPRSKRRRRRKLLGLAESDDDDDDNQDEGNEWIATDDAVKLVRDPKHDTLAPEAVEKTVWQRISGYPAALNDHVHTSQAWIPFDIARALSANPALVQRAVETFYTRDSIQLRAAHKMSRFPPHTSVLRAVALTRTAYAQLVGQKFFPPKIFGRWHESEGTKEWRWRDVGMKIAVGFEMLYQETKSRQSGTESAGITASLDGANKEALQCDPRYIEYIKNLVSANYFKGELQGSQLWTTLETKAATAYISARREDNSSRPSFTSQVDLAISQVTDLPQVQAHEDNDDWLNVDIQDFDEMLEKTIGHPHHKTDPMDIDEPGRDVNPEERMASAQATKLKNLADKVENFVEGEGDIEGARFEDDQFSDEEFSDGDDDDDEQGLDDEMDTREKAERQAAIDNLVPALDPSEYGQMPPTFHRNSQRVATSTIDADAVDFSPPAKSTNTQLDSESEMRSMRPPILPRDKFDGVDSDDESDDGVDEESEEEMPQVVGEVEIDMAEEEEEFLEFSRQALGISDAQWNDILHERRSRGAFVPASISFKSPGTGSRDMPMVSPVAVEKNINKEAPADRKINANEKLNTFEAVMQAMDTELARSRDIKKVAKPPVTSDKGKGKTKEPGIKEGEDIEAAMEVELNALLERDDDDDDEEAGAGSIDYNLIKNFLESFKSQEGLAGPVSNLAGRLQPDWKLPRDAM